jgi:hypothetical protein
MKKTHLKIAILFYGLMMMANFGIAFAQTQILPLQINPNLNSLTLKPLTTLPLQAVTPEAPPARTGATTGTTMETTATSGTTTAGTTTRNGATSQTERVTAPPETPVLPTIDLGTQQTSETTQQCTQQSSATCIDPNQAANYFIPKFSGNQIKIMLIVIAGSLLGALLWIYITYFMNTSLRRRDEMRNARQSKMERSNSLSNEIVASYETFTGSLATINSKIESQKPITDSDFTAFKQSISELELFGSTATRATARQFIEMLSQPTPPSSADYQDAQNRLIQSIRKDIGLD